MVDIMNEAGYDFAAFGNHEFDYKLPQSGQADQAGQVSNTSSCNFKYLGTGTTDITYKPYEIVDYGGTKVALHWHCHAGVLLQVHPCILPGR